MKILYGKWLFYFGISSLCEVIWIGPSGLRAVNLVLLWWCNDCISVEAFQKFIYNFDRFLAFSSNSMLDLNLRLYYGGETSIRNNGVLAVSIFE